MRLTLLWITSRIWLTNWLSKFQDCSPHHSLAPKLHVGCLITVLKPGVIHSGCVAFHLTVYDCAFFVLTWCMVVYELHSHQIINLVRSWLADLFFVLDAIFLHLTIWWIPAEGLMRFI